MNRRVDAEINAVKATIDEACIGVVRPGYTSKMKAHTCVANIGCTRKKAPTMR
jgi:hypothetical protein